ncbi:MAG: Lrp/AsnC family transcriptional regulator [Candidatus Bathyarchaeota archaeon]|nr:Lrp/AsnC family transcriptional regulator [Candidatus Bathyarchaeota archaeon]
MKKIMKKVLVELLKDSKKSDRKLAELVGVSQPTVTRTRSKLVKNGTIRDFTIIPDFAKIGFEIMAITTGVYKVPRSKELIEREQKWLNKHPNIIFASKAQGMGKDAVMISFHRSYAEYDAFVNDLKAELGGLIEGNENILISLKGFVAKPFGLKYLAEHIETY